MEKNEIYKIFGKDYTAMTKEILERAGLDEQIGNKDARIGIKPNLVSPTPPMLGATTHPEVVAGIIEYLQEHGFKNITMMESCYCGGDTMECFEVCGFDSLVKKYGVPFIDAQNDTYTDIETEGMPLKIADCARNTDFMIGVPVMKGHCQTGITCAIKNMKGLVPADEKRRFHRLGLHDPIGRLLTVIRLDFVVVDHICGDLDFEEGGNPVVCDCVMAGKDPVLIDSYVCKLLGYQTSEVPYIGIAAEFGCGSTDIDNATILKIGRNGEADVPAPDEDINRTKKTVELKDALQEVDSCSACYGTLVPVLERLKEEGRLEELLLKIPDKVIHIGQGYQGKTGFVGVGRCTELFEHTVGGCPPSEEDMYEMLINYLNE